MRMFIPGSRLWDHLYVFNQEHDASRIRDYCALDFVSGWKVRIEIPKYKRSGTEFREGVVVDNQFFREVVRVRYGAFHEEREDALQLAIEEEHRKTRKGKRLTKQSYLYTRIIRAWKID